MNKILKKGTIMAVALVAFVIAFPAQALITNVDIAANAGIGYAKLNLKNSIKSSDIKNGSITGKDIKKGSIKSSDIKNGSITADDISAGALSVATLADGAVSSAKILDGTILTGDIATDTILAGNIALGAVGTSEILDGTILTGDISTGGVATGNILDGTILNADLDGGSYTGITTVGTLTSLTVGAAGTAVTQIRNYAPTLTPVATAAVIGTAEQTFTVTGLATTDKVIVNGPMPTSLCPAVTFRVSAGDTLAIGFTTLTAVECTPAAGVYNIVAIRN